MLQMLQALQASDVSNVSIALDAHAAGLVVPLTLSRSESNAQSREAASAGDMNSLAASAARSVAVCVLERGRHVCALTGVPLGVWRWKQRQLRPRHAVAVGVPLDVWNDAGVVGQARIAAALLAVCRSDSSSDAGVAAAERLATLGCL